MASATLTSKGQITLPKRVRDRLGADSTELVWRAKRRFQSSKADISDALIAECALAAGCKRSVKLDKAFAATSGFDLLT